VRQSLGSSPEKRWLNANEEGRVFDKKGPGKKGREAPGKGKKRENSFWGSEKKLEMVVWLTSQLKKTTRKGKVNSKLKESETGDS